MDFVTIQELSEEFRKFCGELSEKEILENKKLIRCIKNIERLLANEYSKTF